MPSISMANHESKRGVAARGNLGCGLYVVLCFLVPILLSSNSCDARNITNDLEALMAFKAAADLHGVLNESWTGVTNPCGFNGSPPWLGITCNVRGRVSEVTVLGLALSGKFAANTLSRLNELRHLTLSNNFFRGQLPDDLSSLTGLTQLWAQNARFSGPFPTFLTAAMGRKLVKVSLAGNHLKGPVPDLSGLRQLISLDLSRNFFKGDIPQLPQGLLDLDLSGNSFTGRIPVLPSSLLSLSLAQNKLTGAIPSNLAQIFPNASFAANPGLCGPPLSTPCLPNAPSETLPSTPLNLTESSPDDSLGDVPAPPPDSQTKSNKRPKKLSLTVILITGAGTLVALGIVTVALVLYFSRKYSKAVDGKPTKKTFDKTSFISESAQLALSALETERSKLVFVESSEHKFELEDLLRASAEMLGKGSFGTSYKAVLESGMIVAVKRMKEVKDMGKKEFDQHMQILGKLRHPNLVPLRAFYYASEEKLLVFDFMPNESLFSLLHGSRGPGRTPLDWISRLRIAHGVALGLNYLHQECESLKIPHGNLKSSNILLGKNSEVCIADFGLVPLMTATMAAQRLAVFRAPEYTLAKRISHKSDVYSFGVLLLELLTGRQPAQPFQTEGIDLPKWVHSVVREEWTGEVFDLELKNFRHGEEEMVSLLQIAMGCVSSDPDQRPKMAEVVKLIENIRQEESFVDSESMSFDESQTDGGKYGAPFNL